MRNNIIENQEYYLDILIENDLYRTISLIKEGQFPNEEEMINNAVNSFSKQLSKKYPYIDKKYIFEKLEEIEKESKKIKQQRETEEKEER